MNSIIIESKTQNISKLNPAKTALDFTIEQKILIDNMVDPLHVISNANDVLKKKLIPFVDPTTKEYFYMIERAQKRLLCGLEEIRNPANPKAF